MATANFLDVIYPIGSIYMNVSDIDPSTFFGGSWERIQDKFLLSAGDTYSAGTTGGEATHKLTVNEMPSHTHTVQLTCTSGSDTSSVNVQTSGNSLISSFWTCGKATATGGNGAHNNMPPYLSVYVWKRIA